MKVSSQQQVSAVHTEMAKNLTHTWLTGEKSEVKPCWKWARAPFIFCLPSATFLLILIKFILNGSHNWTHPWTRMFTGQFYSITYLYLFLKLLPQYLNWEQKVWGYKVKLVHLVMGLAMLPNSCHTYLSLQIRSKWRKRRDQKREKW